MKPKIKSIYAALFGVAIMGASMSSSADALIQNWTLGTASSGSAINTGVNNLDFNGESLVVNSVGADNNTLTSTDVAVFNFLAKNGGTALNLGSPAGQYTAVLQATDTGSLSGGSFTFTGGTLDFYYNTAQKYGTSATEYGAGATDGGLLIGSFKVLNTGNPNSGGGFINPDGTPTANGQISLTAQSTSLLSGFWNTPADIVMAMGFATSNAHLDTASPINSNLTTSLDVLAGVAPGSITTNNPPLQMFIQNGGQFTLSQVPEPGTIALLGIGMLGLGLGSKKRRTS